MTAETQTASRGGRPFIFVFIGLFLMLATVAYCIGINNTLLDKAGWLTQLPTETMFIIPIVLGLLGIVFWVHGHRVYAGQKGISTVFGLALAFLPIIGLLMLMMVPARHKPQLEAPAEDENQPAPAE